MSHPEGRWEFRCLDRVTGREHLLAAEGYDEPSAAQRLTSLGFALSRGSPRPWQRNPALPNGWTPALTWKHSEIGDDWSRWVENGGHRGCSEPDMGIEMIHLRMYPSDRHFLLQALAEKMAGVRTPTEAGLRVGETLCWQWMVERGDLLAALCLQPSKRTLVWSPPRLGVPRRLCLILQRRGDYTRVVDVVHTMLKHRVQEADRSDLSERARKAAAKEE